MIKGYITLIFFLFLKKEIYKPNENGEISLILLKFLRFLLRAIPLYYVLSLSLCVVTFHWERERVKGVLKLREKKKGVKMVRSNEVFYVGCHLN